MWYKWSSGVPLSHYTNQVQKGHFPLNVDESQIIAKQRTSKSVLLQH